MHGLQWDYSFPRSPHGEFFSTLAVFILIPSNQIAGQTKPNQPKELVITFILQPECSKLATQKHIVHPILTQQNLKAMGIHIPL
jgi:hypothetical protein